MLEIKKVHQIVDENKEEIIDFLVRVLQTPSPTGEETKVSQVFKNEIEKMGLDVEVYEKKQGQPNLIAKWSGSENGSTFVFNGHYDVFPPVNDTLGLYGPWSGKIVDGRIYGRGAVDMKSGLCATVMAVAMLKKAGYQPDGTIVLSCDADEEKGGYNGARYLLEQGLLKGDYGVCAEPTAPWYKPNDSGVLITGTGGVRIDINVYAETCHGAIKHPNINAIEKAQIVMDRIREYAAKIQKERLFEPFGTGPFCSITRIHAGEGNVHNMHPSVCTITIDRRIYPMETTELAIKEMDELLANLKAENPLIDYTVEYEEVMPAYNLDPQSQAVQAALEAYKDVTGEDTFLYKRPGGCDAHLIVQKYGYCMPTFGPGNEALSCMEDEWIAVEEYLKFVKVYMVMAMKLLEQK